MKTLTATFVLTLLATAALAGPAPSSARQSTSAEPRGATSEFSTEQLEQIAAPIALYPDQVLAHVLMASTYPIEIVLAARWIEANPGLSEEKLEAALQEQTWDPAVKSLCAFPDVLQRMSENLDWTQDLGDAFLGQKEAVMDAVQRMRRKAVEAGTLESSEELKVTEEAQETIVIQPADPEVVYVPTYYPSAVYGSWSYPYWYYPPLYPPPPAGGVWFGFTVGVIWGSGWGHCNWGHADIDIDIEHHRDFVDRTEPAERRQQVKDRMSDRSGSVRDRADWKHDPSHRKGVGYKDSDTARRYGAGPGQSRVSREQARGYASRGQALDYSRTSRTRDVGLGSRTPTSTRPTTGYSGRDTGRRSSTYSGSRNPRMERASSSRGSASRRSMGARSRGGFRGRR